MNVLVACESSGAVRDAFRERGHNAWSCDVLPSDGRPTFHLQGDVTRVLDGRIPADMVGESAFRNTPIFIKWDLLIAFPPCTYLTIAAEWAYGDGPYHQQVKPGTLVGAARREARLRSLDFVRSLLDADIPRIALENPVGVISSKIRRPDQVIQPHQFGHDASKATCLWLKGLPPLEPTQRVAPTWFCCGRRLPEGVSKRGCLACKGAKEARPRWGNQTPSGQNKLAPSPDRWKARSKTYSGVAAAMAEQWGRWG